MLAVVGAMDVLGVFNFLATPQEQRFAAVMGHSWRLCPWMVLTVSLPALVGWLWAVRSLAPTRLHSAGVAAGFVPGAVGAAAYALVCSETSASFVAVWYTLGIALTGLLGALLGLPVLRW